MEEQKYQCVNTLESNGKKLYFMFPENDSDSQNILQEIKDIFYQELQTYRFEKYGDS